MAVKENIERKFYFVKDFTRYPLVICSHDCGGKNVKVGCAIPGERPIDEIGVVARCEDKAVPTFSCNIHHACIRYDPWMGGDTLETSLAEDQIRKNLISN